MANPIPSVVNKNAIQIENLEFQYTQKRVTLKIPSWSIFQGQSCFLYGPSGSGKTTLLGLLAGILVPTNGSISLLGQAFSTLSSEKRDQFRAGHIGYIFQQFNLIPYLTAFENIALSAEISPARRSKLDGSLEDNVCQLAKKLGVENVLKQYPNSLSVGQAQRIAVARALLGKPEFLICDEPTSALDTEHRDKFIDLLLEIAESVSSTIMFVSHDKLLSSHFKTQVSLSELNEVKISC